jgi:hypothetical protein
MAYHFDEGLFHLMTVQCHARRIPEVLGVVLRPVENESWVHHIEHEREPEKPLGDLASLPWVVEKITLRPCNAPQEREAVQ